ncbi:MAG: phosphogluconate dehydrogenase (NAD(+)-dependent, decarboxylating) [Syntrophaceae bacterium]
MKLAIAGLGRMGYNMALRLARGGHEVFAYNRSPEKSQSLAGEEPRISVLESLSDIMDILPRPRIAWLMLTAGTATQKYVGQLIEMLSPGDIIVEGGNSHYRDSMRRAAAAGVRDIGFVDVGTSGGIWGLTEGYCLSIGGEKEFAEMLQPVFETLAPAPDRGWAHMGPSGAGHFTKMVHNGIEYGLMEAYAEGFSLLRAAAEFNLDLHKVAETWRFGSVIRSWLLDLTAAALESDSDLAGIKGWVSDSGEGRWTVFDAIGRDVPAPAITLSLLRRIESRQEDDFAARLLAVMRSQFGGHEIKKE